MKKPSDCIYSNYPYKRMLIALQKYASTRNLNDKTGLSDGQIGWILNVIVVMNT